MKEPKNILKCDKGESLVLAIGRMKSNRVEKDADKRLVPFYYGYKGCSNILIKYVQDNKDASICITDDFGLHMINELKQKGYTNFTIMLTDQDLDMIKKIVYLIKNTFSEEELKDIQIKTFEECIDMNFDLIISNPPYAAGNDITRLIIEQIAFNQFINLMPLSKYSDGCLYKKIDKIMEAFDWEGDAKQPVTVASLKKTDSTLFQSFDECEIESFDSKLKKYYKNCLNDFNNELNKNYLVHLFCCNKRELVESLFDENKSLFMSDRILDNGVHSTIDSKKGANTLKINIFRNKEMLSKFKKGQVLEFKSTQAKDNALNWFYYESKIANALFKGTFKKAGSFFVFPKVDWTRKWTDEEILIHYGYSQSEAISLIEYCKKTYPKCTAERED